MFDIRKIHEQVIFNAVKAESNEIIAKNIVNREFEDNPTWVKNTMKRLEDNFDQRTVKKIRMKCQCGYAMNTRVEERNVRVEEGPGRMYFFRKRRSIMPCP